MVGVGGHLGAREVTLPRPDGAYEAVTSRGDEDDVLGKSLGPSQAFWT